MSHFNSPRCGADYPFDENEEENGDRECEDDDILNTETFGAAEIVDWETEHKRLTELDVDGFEEFCGEIPSHDEDGPFRSNGRPDIDDRRTDLSFPPQRSDNFNDLIRESSDDFGVDVEQDLQRLVLEVDRDDRIESAWAADPAIKMLSKKIPSKQMDPAGAVGGDVLGTSPIFDPPQPSHPIMPGMDERLGKIWATSAPPPSSSNRSDHHHGASTARVKTVSELEEELGVGEGGDELQRSQHHLPTPQQLQSRLGGGSTDGSVSPLAQQMLFLQQQQQQQQKLQQLQQQQQQQQQLTAAALLQQQQQQQSSRMLFPQSNNAVAAAAASMGLLAQNQRQMDLLRQMAAAQLLLQQHQQQLAGVTQQNQLLQLHQHQQQIVQQLALLQRQFEAEQQIMQHQQQQQQHHHHQQQQQHQHQHQHQQHPMNQHQQQQHGREQHQNERRWHNNTEGSSNGYNRPRRYSEHLGPDRLGTSEDPYAGLMTRSEKEWLISIHHRQLEVDNPYVKDYYYTQLKLKKDLKEREAAISSGQLPLPPDPLLFLRPPVEIPDEFDDSMPAHASTPYIPSQFANTLGKLTTASVHNPRQVIDASVHRDSVEMDDADVATAAGSGGGGATGEGGGRSAPNAQDRYRQLLLTIENCYSLLLRIQEYDISIAKILVPNAPSRHVLINDRHRLKQQLLGIILASEASVTDMFRARKGALLFANVLNKVDAKYMDLCLRSLFKCYHRIRQKSVGVLEEVGPEFLQLITASLSNQDGTVWHRGLLFFIWMHTNHAEILSDKLGLSLVLQIMKQFASSITDQEELEHFLKHVEQFAMNVFVLPPDRRVRPYRSFADLLGFIRKHTASALLSNFADCLTFCMTGPGDVDATAVEPQPAAVDGQDLAAS